MVLSQLVSLPYTASQAAFSLERDNLNRPLILRELFSWKLKDKLNKLNELEIIVFKDSVDLSDIYFERSVFVPAFEFEGIITGIIDNNDNTLEITIKEEAWHFTRRLYRIGDSLKEYNLKLVDPASLPDFLQLILDSANLDMPLISSLSISNLISHFPFETNGVGDVLDAFGSNDGTIVGTEQYVRDKFGGFAFDFNGSTRVNLANESNFDFEHTDPFSFTFRFKGTQTGVTKAVIWKGPNLGGAGIGWGCFQRGTDNFLEFRLKIATGSLFFICVSLKVTNDGEFHDVACTFSGNSNKDGMKIYIDGILSNVGTTETITDTIKNNDELTIGAETDGSSAMTGVVGSPRIYNKELTATEVTSITISNTVNSNPVEHREIWTLGEDIPATSDFDFNMKWKSYYDLLRLVARNSANDVWFEDRKVFFGIKGKTIELERDEKIYNNLKSKIDLDIFGNIVHVVGAEVGGTNVHATASDLVTDLQFDYERVVSNNNLKTQTAVDGVVDRILGEFNSTTPDVTIDISLSVIHKYDIESGDIIKINSNTQTQRVKGFFRVIEAMLGSQRSSLKLQFSKNGQFLPRISDSLYILQAALIKIHDLELNS